MAWIESHQSLRLHPKTLFVCAALKAKRHAVIGHLQCLWWWALDVADLDGWLPAGTNSLTVAGGAEWPERSADSFLKALLAAGFLDEEKGRYKLHDWWDFAGKYNAKRAANKERMRSARATHVQGLPTNLPEQPNQPGAKAPIPTDHNQPIASPSIFRLHEDLCGTVSVLIAQELTEAEGRYPARWLAPAFQEAARQNKRKWAYVQGILENWLVEGFPDEEETVEVEAWVPKQDQDWYKNAPTPEQMYALSMGELNSSSSDTTKAAAS